MIEILSPGFFTQIQDQGRYGHQHQGVPVAGPMDFCAAYLANLLVGNDPQAALIEMSLKGAAIQFHTNTCITITGANWQAFLNDRPICHYRPTIVQSGDYLSFTPPSSPEQGLYAYLAILGGIGTPTCLNSRATDSKHRLGGYEGRALKKGDLLPTLLNIPSEHLQRLDQQIKGTSIYLPSNLGRYFKKTIRIIPGIHWQLFTQKSQDDFLNTSYCITTQSNRLGYRLNGNPLQLKQPLELFSESVTFGTIQVPPSGQPIVLMADHQTVGGYPKIANVASIDLGILAQQQAGMKINFEFIDLNMAQDLWHQRTEKWRQIRQSLHSLVTALRQYAVPCIHSLNLPV